MKKTLLTLSAFTLFTGAWAQEAVSTDDLLEAGFENVTPVYYQYYKGQTDLNKMLRIDIKAPKPANLGDSNWITTNTDGGENCFTPEQIAMGNVLFGAFVYNNNKFVEFKNAFSLYNFGGNLGEVLILNGKNSTLNEKIKDALDLEEAPEIPVYAENFGANFNYSHILDFISMNDYLSLANPDLNPDDITGEVEDGLEIKPIRIRVRAELSAFNNDMTKNNRILNGMYFQNEEGNVIGMETKTIPVAQFADENGNWNPNRWLVHEWEFDYNGIAGYVKFVGTNTDSDIDNGALLVRSLEVFVVPEGKEFQNIEKKNYSEYYDSWAEYSIGNVPSEETVDLYLIGDNVDGANWTLGTNQMTYVDGVYTWTGEVLGSGFKINNGTWDNPTYNIGAKEGKLSLGVAFEVEAGNNPGNIEFDGFQTVEKPTVVYDPVASTVTVTADTSGINSISSNTNSPVEYFNLQGVKVTNPENGLFIRRQGNTTSKVIIR